MQRKIRVLVGKPGLDGHDRGAKVVAAALRDAGMEVIYTGLHQTPAQIVEAAVQEDVDVVALSILSGAHMTLFPEVQGLMQKRGIGDRLLTGGGIIPPEDMEALLRRHVGRLFGPGSSTQDIVHYIREWFVAHHGEGALAPLPPPPAQADLFEAAPGPSPVSVKVTGRAGTKRGAVAAAAIARARAEAAHHAPAARRTARKGGASAQEKAPGRKPARKSAPRRKPASGRAKAAPKRAKPQATVSVKGATAKRKRPAAKKKRPAAKMKSVPGKRPARR